LREREEIAILKATGSGVREIARALRRSPSTISRELRRNASTRGGKLDYRASVAQWKAELIARRPKVAKLAANPRLRDYVQERLSGQIRRPDGGVAPGPQPPRWTGQNKPHRKDRGWGLGWSPEQIANRIRLDFPDDDSMRISHDAQRERYRGRNVVERCFNKLKQWRGIAMRSDKTARNYHAGLCLAATLHWLQTGFSNRA
jgi:transposase